MFTGEGCISEFLKNYARSHALKLREKINSSSRLNLHLTIKEHTDSVQVIFTEYVERSETVTVTLDFVIPLIVDLRDGIIAVNRMVSYMDTVFQQGYKYVCALQDIPALMNLPIYNISFFTLPLQNCQPTYSCYCASHRTHGIQTT